MSNLALDLRPARLEDILGQDTIVKAIKSFAEKDNWPNVFLLYGPPGTGKTTLAKIIAKMVGADDACTHEINASTDNGVDAARALADISASEPFTGKRRVILLNEAHQLTSAAQNALKDPMEQNTALWVLTTDRVEKIEPAIKSRAAAATFQLKTLGPKEITQLVVKAIGDKLPGDKGAELNTFLIDKKINAPREILGIIDQYLAGVPLEQAVHGSEHEPLYRDVAGAVLSGNWTRASASLSQIKTADSRGLIAITSAFFRQELLKLPLGPRADAIAACLVGLDSTGFADGTAYGSVCGLLYKACKVLSQKG